MTTTTTDSSSDRGGIIPEPTVHIKPTDIATEGFAVSMKKKSDTTNESRHLTGEDIWTDEKLHKYSQIPAHVGTMIGNRIAARQWIPHYCLIADMLRTANPSRFHFVDLDATDGGVLCALAMHRCKSSIEKYAGVIRPQSHARQASPRKKLPPGTVGAPRHVQPILPVNTSMDVADRNVRYFGVRPFALFEGVGSELHTFNRVSAYLYGRVDFLYIANPRTGADLVVEFELWGQTVAPGGIVVFGNYHDDSCEGVTETVEMIRGELLGSLRWRDVGALAPGKTTAPYVMQRLPRLSDG